MSNVNNDYFDGYYKEVWRALIPPELTLREVDFMIKYFNLQPGSRVLDLMCGYGRHALALAEKGIEVTAVDNLGDYTAELQEKAAARNLPIGVLNEDILQLKVQGNFDLAICMGNSLNFFNARDTSTILKNLANGLATGKHLLINTWSLAEIAIKQFVAKSEASIGELSIISESQYLLHPTRIESETRMLIPGGIEEVKKAVDYIFSVSEMEALLNNSGFKVIEIYSIPGRKKFSVGDPRAYILATAE